MREGGVALRESRIAKVGLPGRPPEASVVKRVKSRSVSRLSLTWCCTQKRWKPSPALNRYLQCVTIVLMTAVRLPKS